MYTTTIACTWHIGLLTLKLVLFFFFARAGGARKGHEVAFAELDQQFVLLSERLAESVCRTYAAAFVRACVRD